MTSFASTPWTTMVAGLVAATLTGLGLLHLYWALAGRLASERVIPRRTVIDSVSGASHQMPAFRPSVRATVLVATMLFIAAGLVAVRAGLFVPAVSHGAVQTAVVGIAVVFLARAIGDFRIVGVFKPDNGTLFARWDTWLYSPLCVLLAWGTACIAWG